MKQQLKTATILLLAIVLCAAMFMAIVFAPMTAEAFSQEEIDECDRLFAEAVSETIDQNGETGNFVATKRKIYDVDLNELGYVYSYTSAMGEGYAVILVLDQVTVSEIVEGQDPYATLSGMPIYINQMMYAGYANGQYVFANGAALTKDQIVEYVGFRGVGTITESSATVTYTSKTDNKYTAIKNHPGYYYTDSYPSGCTALAAANIVGYYDRLVPNLIPDYASYRTLGSAYMYKGQDDTIEGVISTLYSDIGVNPATGASITKFQNGLRTYCNRQDADVTYTSVMSGSSLNIESAKAFFLAEKPVVLFVDGFEFDTILSLDNQDTYSIYTCTGAHACVGFEYRQIVYTMSNGAISTNNLIKVATGYLNSISKAYLNLVHTSIYDAYGVTIAARN